MMTKPRDHHAGDRVGMVRLARLLSNVISPPVMFACLGLALAWRERPFWSGLAWAAVYGFFVSLAPILFVLYLLRTGRVVELHMSNTNERHLPYLVATLGSLLTLALVLLLQGPSLLRCLAVFNTVTLVAIGIINTRWLISFHLAAATALWLIVALVFGRPAGLALLPLVLLVLWLRLYLRRHTVAQVLAGMALGVGVVYTLALLGCFT